VRSKARIFAVVLIIVIIGAGAGIAAISGGGGGGSSTPSQPITISDPVVTSTVNDVAALYFTIKNSGAEDSLLTVSTDASDSASLHQDVVNGPSSSMKLLQDITVPAHGQLQFKSGAYHVMVNDLKNGLKAGQTVNVTLVFKNAGTVTFAAPVKDR
jgi:copper(I)-binding protein